MGVSYIPLPLHDDVMQWLREEGVAFPKTERPSRWPTPNELRAVLDSLTGHTVTYRVNSDLGWDADIIETEKGWDGWSGTIWTKNTGDGAQPNAFVFHKSRAELCLLILEKLSLACGPFILIEDSSMRVIVVEPGSDPAKLVLQYGY